MRFRGLISTSNEVSAEEVHVDADEELVWVTEYKEEGGRGGRREGEGGA